MNKTEFLEELKSALAGEISESTVNDNVSYYRSYIDGEMRNGRSEADVLAELGDPALIARTIIDVNVNDDARASGYSGFEGGRSDRYSDGDSDQQQGFHAEYNEKGGYDVKYGRFKLNSWYGKLAMIVVLIVVIVLVLSIVSGIISLVAPVLLPVLIIIFLIWLFAGDRR